MCDSDIYLRKSRLLLTLRFPGLLCLLSLAFPRPAHSADPLVLSDIQVLSYVLFITCLTMWDKVCYYCFSMKVSNSSNEKLEILKYPMMWKWWINYEYLNTHIIKC
jgi:hypothetical protein